MPGLIQAEGTNLSLVIVNAGRWPEPISVSTVSSSLTVTAGSWCACPAGTDDVAF